MADAAKSAVKTVQLDGQVILKIMQHCNESLPQLVTGQLLGLDIGHTLEVTDCFAFPVSGGAVRGMLQGGAALHAAANAHGRHDLVQANVAEEDAEDENAGASYQLDMMRCLREVNVDNNTVGW